MAGCSSMTWMVAEKVSWYCALLLILLLVSNCCDPDEAGAPIRRHQPVNDRPCDEIYVVGEGETLQTIIEKCGDPFILEENPHVQDFDDVYPGLVIKITPFTGN
ncbi:LysM domain [Musa troglodytarum]|uniref:LysM domain n=2 Tax=Musa troglodytarum TaxID=320322 RepID=A0A9E7KR97_9LILI|nr:LysM domain [Musa troglodytarum]